MLVFLLGGKAIAVAQEPLRGFLGSYREKYTENAARDFQFGVGVQAGSLFPVSAVVTSSPTGSTLSTPYQYNASFNLEGEIHFSLAYPFQLFVQGGYSTYSARQAMPGTSGTSIEFQEFSLGALPLLAGVRYRFSRGDIVPYIGLAAGVTQIERKGYFDFNPALLQETLWVATLEGALGLEFYFAEYGGLRLEVSGYYWGLPQTQFSPSGVANTITFLPSFVAVRYASGLFFLL